MLLLNMVFGRDIRLARILKEGKMLCIPMDHGISNGPIQGLENIHRAHIMLMDGTESDLHQISL